MPRRLGAAGPWHALRTVVVGLTLLCVATVAFGAPSSGHGHRHQQHHHQQHHQQAHAGTQSATVASDGSAESELAATVAALRAELAAARLELQHAQRNASEARASCGSQSTRRPQDIDPSKADNHNLKEEVDELLTAERNRQRRLSHDDADMSDNGPKEISIYCPKPPQINIVDLSDTDRDHNECLVLNVGAPDLSSRLVLYCDGTTSGASGFDDSAA